MSMKKSIGHVQLVGRPVLVHDEAQDSLHRCRLDNGSEGLAKVDAGALAVAADDPTGLLSFECAVSTACT
jgi:hypothetical protein